VKHIFYVFAAYAFCKYSRSAKALAAHWKRDPKFWSGGRKAFSWLMAHHQPNGREETKILIRILREGGMLRH